MKLRLKTQDLHALRQKLQYFTRHKSKFCGRKSLGYRSENLETEMQSLVWVHKKKESYVKYLLNSHAYFSICYRYRRSEIQQFCSRKFDVNLRQETRRQGKTVPSRWGPAGQETLLALAGNISLFLVGVAFFNLASAH